MDAWPLARVSPPCNRIYQLLQNTIPKCATINPVLHLHRRFKHHLCLQIILKSRAILECNSSLLAISEQNSPKSQDSVPASSHSSPATTCTRHQVNPMALFQLHLLNFQRQRLFSIVHQASSTGCMKMHTHQQDNPRTK